MNEEELKDRAEELLYEVERKKVRVTKAVREYEHRFYDKNVYRNEDEMDDWKSKEYYLIDVTNERDTVFNTIVRLGILNPLNAATVVSTAGSDEGGSDLVKMFYHGKADAYESSLSLINVALGGDPDEEEKS